MFQRIKNTGFVLIALLLFSCSTAEQHKNTGAPPTGQTKYTRVELPQVETRQLKHPALARAPEGNNEPLYPGQQKKNTARQAFGQLQDIAPKNNFAAEDTEIKKLQWKNPSFSTQQSKEPHRGLRVIFDNDIWDNTDYYYTNGLAIELLTPLAKISPVNKILLGTKAPDIEINGFSLRQNMYTPTNPDVTEILRNDRPFSSFLAIGHFRETWNIGKKLYLKSTLELGVLGPASLGGTIQSGLHTEEPLGWQNQVQNNLVVNYYLEIEKGILHSRGFEFNLTGNISAGTLFNKTGGGFSLRLGRFFPVYGGPMKYAGQQQAKNSPLQFWVFAKANTDFVLYDATLQGGMFNVKNPYTIAKQDMQQFVFRASAGIAVYSGNLGIELENFFLTPEFTGGRNFAWGRIKLVAAF